MIALSSFSNKISHEVRFIVRNFGQINKASGTTFLSTRTALGGIGVLWVRSLALFLGEYIPWYIVCTTAGVIGIFYFFWLRKTVKELQNTKKEE